MHNKKKWLSKNVFGFGLTSFFNDFSFEMTTAILPVFIQQIIGTSATPPALGFISGISDAASSVLKVMSGLIADRVKRYKIFLIIGYTLTPLFSGLIGTAQYIWQIILYKTLAWMGRGIREPIRDTWMAKIVSPSFYGHAFGFQRALDTMGAIAGPIATFFALQFFSIKTIFFLSFIPGALSVLSLLIFTHEESPVSKKNEQFNWREHIKELPRNYIYFVFIMFVFGVSNFNKLLIIFRAQELLMGQSNSFILATSTSVLLYVLFNVIRSISEYGLGALSDIMSRKNLLATFGFGLFGLVNYMMLFPSNNVFVWSAIFICAGVSAGAVSALERAYAAQLLPSNVRGIGFGLLQMFDGIGDLISSIIVGLFWNVFSPEIGFLYAMILSIISMILLLLFKSKNSIATEKNVVS